MVEEKKQDTLNKNRAIDKHQLKQVKDFVYLGSILSANERITNEIQHRCSKSNHIEDILASKASIVEMFRMNTGDVLLSLGDLLLF